MSTFSPAPVKPTISLDVLQQVDVRAGTIRSVEDVPASNKLVALTVDFGDHQRRILAGIKREREDPGAMEGVQALFVINLKAKEMAGDVSEGMLFDVGYADGLEPALTVPEWRVPDGARAG